MSEPRVIVNDQDISIHTEVLQQMSVAQKYALFTEIRFLVAQKRAKKQYLDATPFQRVWQVLTGQRSKCQRQMFNYTDRLQELMEELLVQLDNELQGLKFDQLKMIQQLEEAYEMALNSALILINLVEQNDLNYDKEQYECIMADVDRAERRLEEGINEQIPAIGKKFRILHLEPRELSIITESGIESIHLDPEQYKEEWKHLISPAGLLLASAKGPYDVIIHPHGAHLYGIRTERCFDYNEYQLLHYIHTKHPSAGQKIAVMDYYDCIGYVSGYVMEKNGSYKKIFQHEEIPRGKAPSIISRKIDTFFNNNGVAPNIIRLVKCFTVEAHIEKMYTKAGFETIAFDEQWVSEDTEVLDLLLGVKKADTSIVCV